MDWFRSWHGAPTDTKWLVIARRANVAPGIVSAVAWALLDYASQHAERGSVAGFDAETYAAFSGFTEDDIAAVLTAMREKNIIDQDDRLTSWDKRQPKREDNSAERVKAFRERNSEDVTHCNAEKRTVTQSNAPEQIQSREETETETTSSGPLAEVCDAYHRNIGLLTKIIADKLADDVEEYGAAWVLDAIAIAVTAEKRDLRYVEGVLKKWRQNGRTNGNGKAPPPQAGYAIRYTDAGAFLPDGSKVE